MWCNMRNGWFYGKHIWLLFFLALWVTGWNWPLVLLLFFVAPIIYQNFVENGWGEHQPRKRKNDEDDYGDDHGYFVDEKPKRRPVYIRTSDGEFIEVPADELEYV